MDYDFSKAFQGRFRAIKYTAMIYVFVLALIAKSDLLLFGLWTLKSLSSKREKAKFEAHLEKISSSDFVFGLASVSIFQLMSTEERSEMRTSRIDSGQGSAKANSGCGTNMLDFFPLPEADGPAGVAGGGADLDSLSAAAASSAISAASAASLAI